MPFSDTAPIVSFVPTVATTPLAEKLKKDHFGLDQIDWFWRNFLSDDGKGLYASLVEPLTGDFNRIAENGEAWSHVSEQFRNLSKNLTDNTHTLLTECWTRGSAADAYQGYVEINWVGFLYIAEQLSEYMGKGFGKLAEWSVRLAEAAVDVLDKIVEKVITLAAKAVSSLGGVLAGVVEWVATGFDKFPYWSDVEEIIGLVHQVLALHSSIEELVAALQGYYNAYQSIMDAVKSIPEINSTQDVVEISQTISGGKVEVAENKAAFEEKRGELEGQLGSLDRRLNPDVATAE